MRVYKSPRKPFDKKLASQNIGQFLRDGWAKHPESFFIDGQSGLRYTGQNCLDLSKKVADSLYSLGLRSDENVAICCTNTIRTPILLSAIWSLNAVGSGLNFGHQADEYIELAGHYQPKIFVCSKTNLDIVIQVKKSLSCIQYIVVIDENELTVGREDEAKDTITFGKLATGASSHAPEPEVRPDLLAYMPRTSGTTGRSKAVMHTHRTLISAILMQGAPDVMLFPEKSIVACTSLFQHVYCLFDTYGACVYRGFNFVHPQTSEAIELSQVMELYHIDALITTPYSILSIMNLFKTNHPTTRSSAFLQHLKWIITASNTFPEQSIVYLRECLPQLRGFGNCYGQTEIVAAFSHDYGDGFHKPTSIGRILSNGEFRIVDIQTLNDAEANERGELWVRLPTQTIGYLEKPDGLNECLADGGWYRTGDMCVVDDEGYVRLVDRLKEFIKTKYTTISPGEVEAILLQHPSVQDAAVIGIPHPILQNALHAILSTNPPIDESEIHEFLAKNAPDIYSLDGGITFCEKVPRSPIGKLVRSSLVPWVLKRLNSKK